MEPVVGDGRALRFDVWAQLDAPLTLAIAQGTDLSEYSLQVWVQAEVDGVLEELSPANAVATAAVVPGDESTLGATATFSKSDLAGLDETKALWLVVRDAEAEHIWTVGRFRLTREGRGGESVVTVPAAGPVPVALTITTLGAAAPAASAGILAASVVLYCPTLSVEDLQPADGDTMFWVDHTPNLTEPDEASGLSNWTTRDQFTWSEGWADDNDPVNVLILTSDSDWLPQVLAEVTPTGFTRLDVLGAQPVLVGCGGGSSEFLSAAMWSGWNIGGDTIGGSIDPTQPAELIAPMGLAANYVRIIDRTGAGDHVMLDSWISDVSDSLSQLLGQSPPEPYDGNPEPPGAPSPGDSDQFAKGNHVHPPPTPGQIGAVTDDDARLSDARTPTGGAGGALSGEYPNPGFNDEALQDFIAAMLQAGANITISYDDTDGTVTVAATGLQPTSAKDQPGGYAGLNGDGQIGTSALPALAIGETFTVESEAEMLALDVQRGDVAIRSDESRVYRLAGADPTELTDWVLLPVPADAVQAVNGQTGIIVLSYADVGADAAGAAAAAQAYAVQRANHTGTQAISTVTGLQTALDGKSATGHGHATSDVSGLDAALAGKVPTSRTLAGLDLTADRSDAALRTALGLGGAAVLNVGTGAGTVAAGDDARLTDARTPDVAGSNDDFMQRKAGAWTYRTVAQVQTDLSVTDVNRAHRIAPASKMSSANPYSLIAPYGNGSGTLAVATGMQYLMRSPGGSGQTIERLAVHLSASALTSGQTIEVSVYDEYSGSGPGSLLWTQNITIGASTGTLYASSLSHVIPTQPFWVSVLNPSGNAGTATFRTSLVQGATVLALFWNGTPSAVLRRTAQASAASDLSSVTYRHSSDSPGARLEVDATGAFPLIGVLTA